MSLGAEDLMPSSLEALDYNVASSLYESDDFRLYCFKILPCSRRTPHEWSSCPYAHPGEKARRRNVRTHQYSPEMCPAVAQKEECPLGIKCPRSHNIFESWLHPQKYRTLLCKDKDRCSRPVCFFAHSVAELRIATAPDSTPQSISTLAAGSAATTEVAGNGLRISCNSSASHLGSQGSLAVLPQEALGSTAIAGLAAAPAAQQMQQPTPLGHSGGVGSTPLLSIPDANLMRVGNTSMMRMPLQQLGVNNAATDLQRFTSLESSASSNSLLWLPMTSGSANGMASQRLYQAATSATVNVPSAQIAGLSWSEAFHGPGSQPVGLPATTAVLDPPGLLYGAGGQAVSDLAVNNTPAPAACYVAVNTAGVNHGGGYTLVNQGSAVFEGARLIPVQMMSDRLQMNSAAGQFGSPGSVLYRNHTSGHMLRYQ